MFHRRIEARDTLVSNDRDRGSGAMNTGKTHSKIPQGCSRVKYSNKANAMSTNEHHGYAAVSLGYGKAEYH